MKEFFGIVRKSVLFAGIGDQELEKLLGCLSAAVRRYSRDEVLLREGDTVSTVGILLTGKLYILREDYWGNRNIVTAVEPGQVFAESYACVPGSVSDVTVQAAEDSAVMRLDVRRIVTTCPTACDFHARLIRNLLSAMAERNLALNRKLEVVTRRTTRQKLLTYLSSVSRRAGKTTFEIPFDRQQLADYLSVDRSAMSAELGRLRDEGVLAFRKNRFTLF